MGRNDGWGLRPAFRTLRANRNTTPRSRFDSLSMARKHPAPLTLGLSIRVGGAVCFGRNQAEGQVEARSLRGSFAKP